MNNNILMLAVLALVSFNVKAQSHEPIAVGGRLICTLDDSGSVLCSTGDGFTRLQPPSNTPPLTAIAAGDVHVCGLTETGSAFCWGDNDFGQLNAPEDETFINITAGVNFSCGVTSDNRALCWGLNTHGEAEPPTDERFQQLAIDTNTSCGLTLDGEASCWGRFGSTGRVDLAARLNPDAPYSNIVINGNFACGLTDANTISCALFNEPEGDNMIDLAASKYLICGLQWPGNLVCSSNNGTTAWVAHLNQRLSEINSGPDVVALHESGASDTRLCYSDIEGGFGCIVREFQSEPTLPSVELLIPEAPVNLTADVYSESTAELQWEFNADTNIFAIAGADIFRNGELLDTTANRNSYIDSSLIAGVDYEYSVALILTTGARSAPSSSITLNTGRGSGGTGFSYTPVVRPLSPTGLAAFTYSSTEVELIWDRPASVPRNFSGYEIWRNHEFHDFTRGVSYFDINLEPGTLYHYDVVPVMQDGSIVGFSGISIETSVE